MIPKTFYKVVLKIISITYNYKRINTSKEGYETLSTDIRRLSHVSLTEYFSSIIKTTKILKDDFYLVHRY